MSRGSPDLGRTWLLLLIVVLSRTTIRAHILSTANINVTHLSLNTNTWVSAELSGLYGKDSPVKGAEGEIRVPSSGNALACGPNVEFEGSKSPWIALIQRGNCTFAEKINNAAGKNADAVVIFNEAGTGNKTNYFSHEGTGKMVAVMISNIKGQEIFELVRQRVPVHMVIEVGKQHGPWMSQYSIFFVSISFFVVTAVTVGYFIFYTARRLQLARAQLRKQNQLKNEAKKAISQLDLRTLKQGDQETGPDADTCAVCIESYKPNDVVRILTCNHFFHKSCIDPWLLEHRTCPMCKCDILKALGIEVDVEKVEESPDLEHVSSERTGQDRNTEVPEHAIYTLPSAHTPEHGQQQSPVTEDNHHFSEEQRLFNNDARRNTLSVYVLPQDNPAYEEIDLRDEVKSGIIPK
ncbi:E3 ubiquitin-protein ligase RNF128 isoform X2 [Hemitrygon akajei]|uniref:E3 ubiquitin-protein ligase RNF128 isoform X2 n=1 Tax=Hemitrygon akajei TaxID=2704970 RepID=UPI003BF9E6EE